MALYAAVALRRELGPVGGAPDPAVVCCDWAVNWFDDKKATRSDASNDEQ